MQAPTPIIEPPNQADYQKQALYLAQNPQVVGHAIAIIDELQNATRDPRNVGRFCPPIPNWQPDAIMTNYASQAAHYALELLKNRIYTVQQGGQYIDLKRRGVAATPGQHLSQSPQRRQRHYNQPVPHAVGFPYPQTPPAPPGVDRTPVAYADPNLMNNL